MKRNSRYLGALVTCGVLALTVSCSSSGSSSNDTGATAAPSTPAPATTAQAGGPSTSAPPEKASIKLSFASNTAAEWGIYVAEKKGFFADRGLEVSNTTVGSVNASVQQVVGGSYDVGIADSESTLRAVNAGADVLAFASLVKKYPFRVLAAKDITKASDLVGKRFEGASKDGSAASFLSIWLKKNNVDPDSLKYTYAGSSAARVTALIANQVVATVLLAPFDYQAEQKGYHVLVDFSEVVPDYTWDVFVAKKSWLDSHSDVAQRLVDAYVQAIDWIQDPTNKDEAIQILIDSTKTNQDAAEAIYKAYIEELHVYSKNAALSANEIQAVMDVMSEQQGVKFDKQPTDFFTDKFTGSK